MFVCPACSTGIDLLRGVDKKTFGPTESALQGAFRSGRASTCAKLLQLCTWLWSKTLLAVTVAVHSVEKAKVGLVLVFVD